MSSILGIELPKVCPICDSTEHLQCAATEREQNLAAERNRYREALQLIAAGSRPARFLANLALSKKS